MEHSIWALTIYMFLSQLFFIGARTINVKAVASGNIFAACTSGTLVHWGWLLSIGLGAFSMKAILIDFQFEYIPVIMASTLGGIIGTIWGMKNKRHGGKAGKDSNSNRRGQYRIGSNLRERIRVLLQRH